MYLSFPDRSFQKRSPCLEKSWNLGRLRALEIFRRALALCCISKRRTNGLRRQTTSPQGAPSSHFQPRLGVDNWRAAPGRPRHRSPFLKIRLRLILAFFLLAVVPLTGLVLYSYYASLQAVRQSQEEEAIATIGELERRMEETRFDLEASFQRIASRSAQTFILDPSDSDQPDLQRGLQQVFRELGDKAGLLESFEIQRPNAPTPPKRSDAPDGSDAPRRSGACTVGSTRPRRRRQSPHCS